MESQYQMQDYQKIFGIMVPGELPFFNFELVNDMLVVDIPNPSTVSTLAFFLNVPLPDGLAGALYYSPPPFEGLQFIGAIANTRPSDIFNTGFALNPHVNEISTLKLVVKIEPLENIKELVQLTNSNELQKEFAKKVALNLYNFMLSYNKEGMLPGVQADEFLVIPSNFLEKWLVKFDEKYRHDPNFLMKTSDQ